jgi:hypothetical protein
MTTPEHNRVLLAGQPVARCEGCPFKTKSLSWTGLQTPPNMRMHLQKPRARWSAAGRFWHASFQVIRGR